MNKLFAVIFCLIFLLLASLSFLGVFYQSEPTLSLKLISASILAIGYAVPLILLLKEESIRPWKPWPFLFLILINHLTVQLTGGTISILFFGYYLLLLLVGLRGTPPIAIILWFLFVLLEGGSVIFKGRIGLEIYRILGNAFLFWIAGWLLLREQRGKRNLKRSLSLLERKASAPHITPTDVDREAVLHSLFRSDDDFKRDAKLLNEEISSLAEMIQKVFNCQSVVVFLREGIEDDLLLQGAVSETKTVNLESRIKVGQGVIGWAAKEGRDLQTGDFKQGWKTLGYYRDEVIVHSLTAVPIILEAEIKGVLAIDSEKENAFEWKDRELLKGFAELLAWLLHYHAKKVTLGFTATQFAAINDLLRKLTSKLEVREIIDLVVDLTKKIADGDHLLFFSVDEDKKIVLVERAEGRVDFPQPRQEFSLTSGTLLGLGVEQRNTIYISDLYSREIVQPRFSSDERGNHGFSSFLCLPLLVEEKCLAVLVLEDRRKALFTPEAREVLGILANQAALAMKSARMYEEKVALAIKDGLTGLFNHRHFQELLTQEIETAKKNQTTLSLALLDIDHFKKLNDTYGHPAGDSVLKEMAEILLKQAERQGWICRYGGEEFALILPGGISAKETYENIRTEIQGHRFSNIGQPVTVSLGVAKYPEDATFKSLLIEKADQALYKAKEEGRNRVVYFSLMA
ncbi:MAG: diguanylate cyclase [Candidatus Edwardsbacteria bacterium]